MDGEEVTPPSDFSPTRFFEDSCPFFMSIGMTYDLFWNGDSDLTRYYLKAYELQQDRLNQQAYIQGYYYSEGAFLAVCNARRERKDPYQSYLKVVEVLPRTEEQYEQMVAEQQKREYEKIKARLKARADKTKGGSNG
jgi:hypothetical protein